MPQSDTFSHTPQVRSIGILSAMPDERIDPSQNTQAFQAWVDNNNNTSQAAQPAATGSKLGFIVAGAVVAVVLVVVVVFALL